MAEVTELIKLIPKVINTTNTVTPNGYLVQPTPFCYQLGTFGAIL